MANELDETKEVANEEGRDAFVIEKQLPVQKSTSATVLYVICWVLGIIPGLIWFFKKKKVMAELQATQQKIQAQASQIDNYMEQRVVILQNAAKLLDKAIDLDKDTLTSIAAYRSGQNKVSSDDALRNEISTKIDNIERNVQLAFESYPNLQAHNEIADCLQQNSYLQKEITAARELYNDAVLSWNTKIQQWPIYVQVASKAGYTTRIPFSTSKAVKEQARGTFF